MGGVADGTEHVSHDDGLLVLDRRNNVVKHGEPKFLPGLVPLGHWNLVASYTADRALHARALGLPLGDLVKVFLRSKVACFYVIKNTSTVDY